MTTCKSILLAILLLSCHFTKAQTISDIHVVLTNRGGLSNTISFSVGDVRLHLSPKGQIQFSLESNDSVPEFEIEYYDDIISHRAGKPKSVNNIEFDYYDDVLGYRSGKLMSINDIDIDYYNDFYSYASGKLKSIDHITLEYYDDFRPEMAGKLKSITSTKAKGNIEIDYFDSFNSSQSGRLKSVNGRLPGVTLDIRR